MLTNIKPQHRTQLLAGFAVLGVLTLIVIIWLLYPRYQKLAENLPLSEASDVITTLEESEMDYQLKNGGQDIFVSSSELDKALINLANATPDFQSKGLELYDNTDHSMTEHAQQVNYQRALQGELERTLVSLQGIEQARVHLSLAKSTLFSADREASKASVFLQLEDGLLLRTQQIKGIKTLLANAIENLNIDNIALMNHHGEILAANADAMAEPVSDTGSRSLESTLEDKVNNILNLYFPKQDTAVSVKVRFSRDKRKETIQSVLNGVDGKGSIVREKHQLKQPVNDSEQETDAVGSGYENSEVEYLHGRKIEEITYADMKVEKISLAVAIKSNLAFDSPMAAQLKRLAASAAGIDLARGDQFSFEIMPHTTGVSLQQPTQVSRKTSDSFAPEQHTLVQQQQQVLENRLISWGVWLLLGVITLAFIWTLYLYQRRTSLSIEEKQVVFEQLNHWLTQTDSQEAKQGTGNG